MKGLIRKILTLLLLPFGLARIVSPRHLIRYLRKKGAIIGENIVFMDLFLSKDIDLTRPTLIEIGDNVFFNDNFRLITHDYISRVFLYCYNDFLPSSGRVKIGSNVSFGINCTVLKGVTIGDNCFIAAGSIVTKDIPAGSVAAGIPAKVICTMDEYYEKRKQQCELEAIEYARSIKERLGRVPELSDFWEEFVLCTDSENMTEETKGFIAGQLQDKAPVWLKNHKAKYKGLNEFLKAAGVL